MIGTVKLYSDEVENFENYEENPTVTLNYDGDETVAIFQTVSNISPDDIVNLLLKKNGDEPLDGDEVDTFVETLRVKLNQANANY